VSNIYNTTEFVDLSEELTRADVYKSSAGNSNITNYLVLARPIVKYKFPDLIRTVAICTSFSIKKGILLNFRFLILESRNHYLKYEIRISVQKKQNICQGQEWHRLLKFFALKSKTYN
jgi:hypothetical protein